MNFITATNTVYPIRSLNLTYFLNLFNIIIAKSQNNFMKNSLFTVYIEQDEDGVFIGSVPSVPSCYAQGKTQEEMLDNLRDVLKLCLRNIDAKVV